MIKIQYENDPVSSPRDTSANSLAMGQVFLAQKVGYGDGPGPFLRTYAGVVNLSSPRQTWDADVPIEGYQPVETTLQVAACRP